LAPLIVGGLCERAASDVVAGLSTGTALGIGSGPGLVALTIALRSPGEHALGVDVSVEMALAMSGVESAVPTQVLLTDTRRD
jgi:tRNA1(Val) A37 N6-methylase TrmN6